MEREPEIKEQFATITPDNFDAASSELGKLI